MCTDFRVSNLFKGEKVTTWKYLRIPDELLPSDKATDNIGRFLFPKMKLLANVRY